VSIKLTRKKCGLRYLRLKIWGFFIAFAIKIGFLFIKAQPLRILSDVFTEVEQDYKYVEK